MNPLNHQQAQDLILGGEDLSAAEQSALAAHLATCPACRDFAAFHAEVRQLLHEREPATPLAPRDLQTNIAAAQLRLRRSRARTWLAEGAGRVALAGMGILLIVGLILAVRSLPPRAAPGSFGAPGLATPEPLGAPAWPASQATPTWAPTAAVPSPTASIPRAEPEVMPTALPAAPESRIYLDTWQGPLYGAPPYTAQLTVRLPGGLPADKMCAAVTWDFGDGSVEERPCDHLRDDWTVDHEYREPGTYHPSLTIRWDDGTTSAPPTPPTVIVARPQPVPVASRILYWTLWGLSLVAAAAAIWWLRRRPLRLRLLGWGLVTLALITFVPPFSYVPDPAGLIWGWSGGYRYDPRLPFVDRTVLAGDPEDTLRPYLDGLIGQTGLDPLDPLQPLASYAFRQVRTVSWHGYPWDYVVTRFVYADNTYRDYAIPLYQPRQAFRYYRSDWRYDGLGRLRTEHRELPEAPFASTDSSVRLEASSTVPLDPGSDLWEGENPMTWGPAGQPWQHLAWSPDGEAFLATKTTQAGTYTHRQLWLVFRDGRQPVPLAEDVVDYGWSPDGEQIVFTQIDSSRSSGARIAISAIPLNERRANVLARISGLPTSSFPGLNQEGAWYADEGSIWLAPYDGGQAQRIGSLPQTSARDEEGYRPTAPLVRPSPAGTLVACIVDNELYLGSAADGEWREVDRRTRDVSWSPDGSRLASLWWATNETPPSLKLIRANGDIERIIPLAPNGEADVPQWTPDGRYLFVQTYPFDGRRIVTVDVEAGQALDLSQPRWDAWFALSPDGEELLLTNGRGGFWITPITYGAGSARGVAGGSPRTRLSSDAGGRSGSGSASRAG